MKTQSDNSRMILRLCFKLLPVQVLLCAIGAINGIVSTLFASNFIGMDAMSAIGLYQPIGFLVGSVANMLAGGAQILCGQFKGKNQVESAQAIFSLDLTLALLISLFLGTVVFGLGALDLTRIFTNEETVRQSFNQYLLGLSFGLIPNIVSAQLSGFLSLENQMRRVLIASFVYIALNPILDYLFLVVWHLEALGLALSTSIGYLVFCLIEAQYFFSKKSVLHFSMKGIHWKESWDIIRIGAPGALTFGYQAVRGIVVNALILTYVGSVGLSAFTACNAFLSLFWAIPTGMQAVTRMLFSVSVGEEDKKALIDTMRVALSRYFPLMLLISFGLILLAVPFTLLYYPKTAGLLFDLTKCGFMILPLCMPLSVFCLQFTSYGQASNKQVLIHGLAILDGVVSVSLLSLLLVPGMGLLGVYWANVGNGVISILYILLYAWIMNRHFPKTIEELMVIPSGFGVPESERMDIPVKTVEDVTKVSTSVEAFCREKGIDKKKSYIAALSLEEMAGNVVEHGFTKDRKTHAVDVRAVHKDGTLILTIKDDCVPFDPAERAAIFDPKDPAKNIGIRMVYELASRMEYQNILGLNVLTIRI